MLEYSQLTNVVIVSGEWGRDSAIYIHGPFSPKPVRKSISRQVDKKLGVPKEEKGVWGSQGGDRSLGFSRRRKGQMFFSKFLSKDYITIMHPAFLLL